MVLISDAPSKSETSLSFNPMENLQFIPDNNAINVSTKIHPWIATEVSLILINFFVTMNRFKGGLMDVDSGWYHSNSKTGLESTIK
jgi:hypothetical protein